MYFRNKFSKLKLLSCLIVIGYLGMTSCKDDPIVEPDKIYYKEFQPYVELTSVDTFYNWHPDCGSPWPKDSSIEYLFDIDSNSINDFKISIRHFYKSISPHPCANYNYIIGIEGSSSENLVSGIGIWNIPKYFSIGELIESSLQWDNSSTILYDVKYMGGPYGGPDFTGDKFMGLSIDHGEYSNFAWLRINKNGFKITLKSFAINFAQNKAIKAGQKE